jgi:predicted Zn-dependent peptidase
MVAAGYQRARLKPRPFFGRELVCFQLWSAFMQRLDNGLMLVTKEVRWSQSVAVHGYLNTGAVLDPEGLAGLAAFTAENLRSGAQGRSGTDSLSQLDAVGATLSIAAGRHVTVFRGRCLSEDLPLVLDLLTDRLVAPRFLPREVEQRRSEVAERLETIERDPGSVAEAAFRQSLYGLGHPYGRLARPTSKTVRRFLHDDLLEFYRKTYHPTGGMVAIAGNIDARAAADQVGRSLGEWRPAQTAASVALPPLKTPGRTEVCVAIPDSSHMSMILGFAGPSAGSRDFHAAQVANVILGKLGVQGRVGRSLRGNGLAYECGSRLSGGRGPGPWFIHAVLRPESFRPAVQMVLDDVRRLREELVGIQELLDARNHLIDVFQLSMSDNPGKAAVSANAYLHGTAEDMESYCRAIADISRADVLAVARRYLHEDAYVLAAAGHIPSIKH